MSARSTAQETNHQPPQHQPLEPKIPSVASSAFSLQLVFFLTHLPLPATMSRQQAFLPLHPLPHSIRSVHRPAVCSATPSRHRPARALSILTAAILTTLTPLLPVHAKELRYDGRQELDSKEKAMSLTLTGGTFAALSVWAWKQNRRDDQLEEIRIKEEVERLEKLKAEFMDVEEDDPIDDEDLLASLRERIGEEGNEEDDGEENKSETTEEGSDVDMLKRMWDATDDADKTKS